MKQTLFFFLFFCGTTFNSLFAQNIQQEYVLGTTKDIFVTEGKFFDNGGKEGNIQNQYFITTLHGADSIEIYFEEFFIPDGALLNIYRGQPTQLSLVASFGSKDKIYNVLDEYITIEYVPAKYNVTPAKGFQGIVRKGHRGTRAAYPENDCPGAIPICNNLTVVALGGKYTELGAINDDAGSCYSGTGNGGSVWYSFQPQADGPLDFTLTPTAGTDYDFVLWDITSGCGANQRVEKSCNFSVTQGTTGLSSVNCNEAIGSCTTNDCSTDAKASDCNRFNRRPNVLQSHKYAVCINIYGGSNGGFDLQFKNEATSVNITDVTPPTIVNATANSCPSASQFKLRFSEYVDCSTIQTADFTLPGHTITLNNTNCSNNSSTSVDVTITPALTAGTYSLNAQNILDLCGNNMNSNFSIVIGASPNPTAATSGGICKSPGFLGIGFTYSPSSVTLTAGGGTYYQWSDGQVGASIGVSPTTTTTYTVTVTQGACPGTASVVVNVESAPTPSIPDQNFCAGQSRTLTATGGGTYQWYTGPSLFGNGTAIAAPTGTAATLNASPSGTTTYRVIVTSPAGCKGQDDVTLTLVTTNCCNASITPVSLCSNDAPVTLTVGTAGGTFSGPGITNTATGVFDPATAGVGSHKIYYTLGCGTDSAIMTVAGCSAVNVCKETNGNLTVSGGTAPFTWSVWDSIGRTCSGILIFGNCSGTWNKTLGWKVFGGGATTVTPPAGKDTVKVVDGAGTTKTFYTIASIPSCSSCPTLTVTPSNQVNVKCFGLSTGSFSVTTTGGASPYNYVLKNGATTVATFNAVAGSQPFTGLPAGTYTLNVTDANACPGTATIIITQPAAALVVNTTPTATTCGLSNGSATTTVTGGTTNYTYVWNNGGGSASGIANVAANTYTVTVTDANACTATASAVINTSTAITATASATATTCGAANGTATANVSAGTGPFAYLWSNAQTTNPAINLAAATYTVTITGAGGCTATAAATVNPSTAITATASATATTCGAANGTATANVSAGTGPFTYLWSNAQTTNPAINLAAATYTVTITGAGGCTATAAATVNPSTAITATASATATTCGAANGTATANVSAGTGPFTYVWSNTQTSNPAINLAAASYTVTITGAGGCTATATATVNPSAAPNISAVTTTDPTCAGQNNGSITSATAAGGTGALQFGYALASNPLAVTPIFTFPVTNVAPGTYIVGVQDASSCRDTFYVTIGSGPTCCNLVIQSATVANPTCGNTNGSAGVTMAGGTPPYTYTWSANAATGNSATASNLGAGTYGVTIQAGAGCQKDTTFVLAAPNTPNITAFNTTNEICQGNNDGSIVSASAANSAGLSWGYALLSNPSAITPIASFPVNNLAPGTYILGIADPLNTNCSDTIILTIAPGPFCCTLAYQNVVVSSPSCGNNNGNIAVSMTGGTGTYTYTWSTNANTGNTGTAAGLGAGTYTLTITSGAGCQKDTSFTLAAPSLPNITAFNTSNETCLNKNDGSITSATATSTAGLSWGYAPLSNPSAITPIASFPVNNLAPGTYILGIADPLNTSCADTVIFTITAGPLCCNLSVSAAITAPTCGNTNGAIDVTVTQGSGNYQYKWNTVVQGEDTSNIASGSYAFHLDDLTQGCALDTTFVVNNSNGPQINSVSQSKESCAGLQDGSAWITATGISLNYLWSNGLPNNATQNGLAAGTYFFTVSDINNCSVTGNVTVALGGSLTVNNQLTDPSCLGNDGAINITSVLNGNPPYQYSLNYGGFGSSKNFTSLSSGSYDVVVQDQKGCKDTVTYVLNAAVNNVSATLTATDPTCIGNDGVVDITNASGGTIPYQFSFNGGAFGATTNFSSLGAGGYTVIVKDNKSCADTLSANLVAATSFTVTTATIDATCGVKNGELHFVMNGGKSPFQITDGSGANLALDNFGLGGGRIDYTVKDANQCTQSGFVVLTDNPFTIQKLRSDTSLCGNVAIDLDASNYPCYTHYLWSNGDTTATVTASTSGTYAVTITDDLGNVLYDSVHITLYALPSISLPEDTFIYEGQSIVLNGTVSGGSGVGTYTWTPSDLLTCSKCPSPKAVPRDSTTFTVVYTDQAGCEATDFINIMVLNDQSLYIPNAFSPNGDGRNDELKIFARFVKEFNWSVFNRWGEKVFETNDINVGWDGRYKGVLQPPSVYVYYTTITYLNNKTVHNQGSVTLIR